MEKNVTIKAVCLQERILDAQALQLLFLNGTEWDYLKMGGPNTDAA